MRRPRIAITIGDPGGVGAEIALKALVDAELSASADWVVVGDTSPLEASARTAGMGIQRMGIDLVDARCLAPGAPVKFGELRGEHGAAAAEYVRIATEMCLRGEADAMVTAPLNKEAVALSGMRFRGLPFSGHTEYIAQLCGATESRMLLVSDKLATVQVSTHIALAEACKLDQRRIARTIELGDAAMRLLRGGGAAPRIAVCGLNPHAGEHGLFGAQDGDVIAPAVNAARRKGIDYSAPHSADTVFMRGVRGEFDLIVAMYHDQGHIPMKLIDFESTVNVSLGIPVIRTSVDHGTAFDIAGKNCANPANMRAAMRLATCMAAGKLAQTEGGR